MDRYRSLLGRLKAAAANPPPHRPDAGTSAALPEPVRRYLRLAIPHEGAGIRLARLEQAGTLRTAPGRRWMRFRATHVVAPDATAFLWDAQVRATPFVGLRVLDSLIAGEGSGWVGVFSRFTLDASKPAPEMDHGALHRFLAEAVWYPTALMPSDQLAWTGIDDTRALATLRAGTTSVSLEFRFKADGTVAGIYTPARWGRFGRRYEQRPWEGHFADYAEADGFVVPRTGDVGWHDASGWQAVWRGEIRSAIYDRATP